MAGMNLRTMTIGKKLLIFGILGSSIPLLVFGAIAVWDGCKIEKMVTSECNKLATADLDHIVDGLCATLADHQNELQRKINSDLNATANELTALGGASLGSGKSRLAGTQPSDFRGTNRRTPPNANWNPNSGSERRFAHAFALGG